MVRIRDDWRLGAAQTKLTTDALYAVLAFAWGFSAVANFGILARQRSLMLPFLFVLVSSVPRSPKPRPDSSDTTQPEGQVRPLALDQSS